MRRILVVEDEAALRRLMAKMLQKQGFEVVEAGSPSEALERGEDSGARVDLVITDIMMPGMTGHELAEALSARHPRARVLFMSGYSRADVEAQGLLSPEQPFLSKPFNTARLREAIDDLL